MDGRSTSLSSSASAGSLSKKNKDMYQNQQHNGGKENGGANGVAASELKKNGSEIKVTLHEDSSPDRNKAQQHRSPRKKHNNNHDATKDQLRPPQEHSAKDSHTKEQNEKQQEKEQEKEHHDNGDEDAASNGGLKRRRRKKRSRSFDSAAAIKLTSKLASERGPGTEPPRRVPAKNPFVPRASHFDHSQKDSSLNTSEFRGFFNLFLMAGFFFICSANVRQLIVEGTLVGLKSLRTLIPLDMIPVWLLLVATSHCVVFIQKLRLRRAPVWFTWTLYVVLQAILFFGTIWMLLVRAWPIIPTGVYLGEMIVITMKMHSYVMTNREYEIELAERLKKKKKSIPEEESDPNKFPNTVTLGNFFYFLCAPTLVYEQSYPRTEKVRIGYLIEKAITVVGTFSVLHIIVNKYITPILLQTSTLSVFEAITYLIMPFMFCYILVFFIVFDIICNACAEMTRFSDRQFYSDWWNSTTWDEFARKWNKPVHEWLLRHVYLESLKSFKGDRFSATLATFLCSSVAHELVVGVMMRCFKPWMFVLQMTQVPLIIMGRFLKGTRAGNLFFWFSMLVGPPLLAILYCREYVMSLSPAELKEIETSILDNVYPNLLI